MRKQDQKQREEQESLLDLYLQAVKGATGRESGLSGGGCWLLQRCQHPLVNMQPRRIRCSMTSSLCRSRRIRKAILSSYRTGPDGASGHPICAGSCNGRRTDLRVMEIDDNFSTHALIDQDGGRVRIISADADWIPRRMRGYPIAAE